MPVSLNEEMWRNFGNYPDINHFEKQEMRAQRSYTYWMGQ